MKALNLWMSLLLLCCMTVTIQACGGSDDSSEEPGKEVNGGDDNQENPGTTDEVGFDVESIINTFWNKTSYTLRDSKRVLAMDRMQAFADFCENTEFKKYMACEESQEAAMENGSILLFYRKSLDKVLEEVKTEKVAEGKVVMWQLYNMGYVVKTPTHTFGIDLKHKYATRFVPYIEFLLVTHQHDDHYGQDLLDAMANAGKPVYSNFVDNAYKITGAGTVQLTGDLKAEVAIVDHNKTDLKNFVVTYRIDCGADTKNCVVYHVGDACDEGQLNPTLPVDVFIPHLANNLDMPKAVKAIKPEVVLLSHILEMEHPTTWYRWSYQYGIKCCEELEQDAELKYEKAYLPVWGEKITYSK